MKSMYIRAQIELIQLEATDILTNSICPNEGEGDEDF